MLHDLQLMDHKLPSPPILHLPHPSILTSIHTSPHHQVLLDILYGKYLSDQDGQALEDDGRGQDEGQADKGGIAAVSPGGSGCDGQPSEPLGTDGTKNERTNGT